MFKINFGNFENVFIRIMELKDILFWYISKGLWNVFNYFINFVIYFLRFIEIIGYCLWNNCLFVIYNLEIFVVLGFIGIFGIIYFWNDLLLYMYVSYIIFEFLFKNIFIDFFGDKFMKNCIYV